jgi:acetoin utilization protein AcuB
VTDRDIRLNLPSQATTLSVWEMNYLLARLTVGQVMSRTVIQVAPDRDAQDAARLMIEHKIDSIPIVSYSGTLAGLVTSTDLLSLLVGENHAHPLPFEFRLQMATSDGDPLFD